MKSANERIIELIDLSENALKRKDHETYSKIMSLIAEIAFDKFFGALEIEEDA